MTRHMPNYNSMSEASLFRNQRHPAQDGAPDARSLVPPAAGHGNRVASAHNPDTDARLLFYCGMLPGSREVLRTIDGLMGIFGHAPTRSGRDAPSPLER
jgi:hypothetical protein